MVIVAIYICAAMALTGFCLWIDHEQEETDRAKAASEDDAA